MKIILNLYKVKSLFQSIIIVALFLLFPLFSIGQSLFSEVETLIKQEDYQKAEVLMIDYIAKNPNDAKGIELLGDSYGYQAKWDQAINEFKKLTTIDDNNANYHYKYAGALGMKTKQVSKLKAIGYIGDLKYSFTKAAELDPKHINARWALVELYMELPGIVGGSSKKALKYAEELQVLSEVDGYLAKGFIYERDDQPELAEQHYVKAVEVGGSLVCYEKLSNFYQNSNQPEKAIESIEEAHDKYRRNTLHYQIAKVSLNYNFELDKGVRCLKRYIKYYTVKDAVAVEWAYLRLAQIYKLKNNKKEALKWVDKAISIRSDFPEAIEVKESLNSI